MQLQILRKAIIHGHKQRRTPKTATDQNETHAQRRRQWESGRDPQMLLCSDERQNGIRRRQSRKHVNVLIKIIRASVPRGKQDGRTVRWRDSGNAQKQNKRQTQGDHARTQHDNVDPVLVCNPHPPRRSGRFCGAKFWKVFCHHP